MRASQFKNSPFYHFNFHYTTTGFFKELDWIHVQKTIFTFACLFKIEIQALVMMDTHVHLLFETSERNENFFCSTIERKLNSEFDLSGYCEPILSKAQYLNTYKYIYNNPVDAGLALKAEDYPFSSLSLLLGNSPNYCVIADKLGLIQNPTFILKWLNKPEDVQLFESSSQKVRI